MSWALNGRRVPVEQIRLAILGMGLTNREIARRADMTESGVRASLGAKSSVVHRNGTTYGPYYCKTLGYDRAVRLVRAAGLDPVDVGL